MKEKIKQWYMQDLWSKEMVWDAVERGFLTEKDYIEIVQEADTP